MDEELQKKNGVLVEKLRAANQQDERYTFEEDVSDDFKSTSDFVVRTVFEPLSMRFRRVIDAPNISCGPNEKRDRKGKCRKGI